MDNCTVVNIDIADLVDTAHTAGLESLQEGVRAISNCLSRASLLKDIRRREVTGRLSSPRWGL